MAPKASRVYFTRFGGDKSRIRDLLKGSGILSEIERFCQMRKVQDLPSRVLIKPNIVNDSPPPVTTPAWVVKELYEFLEEALDTEIVIADGTGELDWDTFSLFDLHGYTKTLAGARFADLNTEPCRFVPLPEGKRWEGLYLPEIVLDSFVISVPVLKAHTLAGVTLSMKNMIGVCPPKHYQEHGHWKKSAFHRRIQAAIFDLNRARRPDFVLLDATVGMAASHLGGPTCDPPVDILAAGSDPVALDAFGARLLGRPWQDIGHIRMADGILGSASDFRLEEIP
jgi:uncharacterized protein (DUF362 family)